MNIKYKIQVTKSCCGNYIWAILNANGKKLADSYMFTRYNHCMRSAKEIAKKMGVPVEYNDLNNDYCL